MQQQVQQQVQQLPAVGVKPGGGIEGHPTGFDVSQLQCIPEQHDCMQPCCHPHPACTDMPSLYHHCVCTTASQQRITAPHTFRSNRDYSHTPHHAHDNTGKEGPYPTPATPLLGALKPLKPLHLQLGVLQQAPSQRHPQRHVYQHRRMKLGTSSNLYMVRAASVSQLQPQAERKTYLL